MALSKVKRIRTVDVREELVQTKKPLKITQRDIDDLNRKIAKDAKEAEERRIRGYIYAQDIWVK